MVSEDEVQAEYQARWDRILKVRGRLAAISLSQFTAGQLSDLLMVYCDINSVAQDGSLERLEKFLEVRE